MKKRVLYILMFTLNLQAMVPVDDERGFFNGEANESHRIKAMAKMKDEKYISDKIGIIEAARVFEIFEHVTNLPRPLKDIREPEKIPAHVFHQNLLKRATDGWNYPTEIELITLKSPPIHIGPCPVDGNVEYFRAREWIDFLEPKMKIYECYYWIKKGVFPQESGWIGEIPQKACLHRNNFNPDFMWRPSSINQK
jgi:hypothetical protein